jgi:hypothetical protein
VCGGWSCRFHVPPPSPHRSTPPPLTSPPTSPPCPAYPPPHPDPPPGRRPLHHCRSGGGAPAREAHERWPHHSVESVWPQRSVLSIPAASCPGASALAAAAAPGPSTSVYIHLGRGGWGGAGGGGWGGAAEGLPPRPPPGCGGGSGSRVGVAGAGGGRGGARCFFSLCRRKSLASFFAGLRAPALPATSFSRRCWSRGVSRVSAPGLEVREQRAGPSPRVRSARSPGPGTTPRAATRPRDTSAGTACRCF